MDRKWEPTTLWWYEHEALIVARGGETNALTHWNEKGHDGVNGFYMTTFYETL